MQGNWVSMFDNINIETTYLTISSMKLITFYYNIIHYNIYRTL